MSAEDRIREIREIFHLNQRELGEKIGVTSQLISQMESGKTPISTMTARAMEAELGVSANWLLYGTGEMVSEKKNQGKSQTIPELTPVLAYFPAVAEGLNRLAGKMNLADWQALNSFCLRRLQEENDQIQPNDKKGEN